VNDLRLDQLRQRPDLPQARIGCESHVSGKACRSVEFLDYAVFQLLITFSA
jgi:hypothetical protein